MTSKVGTWMFTFGIASFFIAGSDITSIAQPPGPVVEAVVLNECQPGGNLVTATCTGRCVKGSTSWSCTPGQEERTINGQERTVNVCYCE